MAKQWFKHGKWPRVLVWLHSYSMISFVLLMVTGIGLVTPALHTVLIPYLPYLYQVHILLGLVFAVTLLAPLARLLPKGRSIRRFDWLLPMGLGTIIVLTGVLIWLVAAFPTSWRSAGFIWHGRVSYVLGAWLIVHAFYKAWGYRPKNDGINAKVAPERRMFLRWLGGGVTAAAVLSILDPVGLLYRWLQTRTAAQTAGGTARIPPPPQFPEYYTVIGAYPAMEIQHYRLTVDGLVARPQTLTWQDIEGLPAMTQTADFHCVTGWSVANVQWTGVHLSTLAQLTQPTDAVKYVHFYSFDGAYTESMRLAEAFDPSVLLAYALNDTLLRSEQGYPLRLIVPKMYGYKSIKWVNRIVFSDKPLTGYWEQRGYSTEAYFG